jgi:hypothetical protein
MASAKVFGGPGTFLQKGSWSPKAMFYTKPAILGVGWRTAISN